MKTISISEIFGPTIQGEGALIGRPTVFVRTGGLRFPLLILRYALRRVAGT